MFLQEECFINIIKDLILSQNRVVFVAVTNRKVFFVCLFVFVINIVSSFVIRHISVSDSVSEQLLVLNLIVSFYFKSCPKNRK